MRPGLKAAIAAGLTAAIAAGLTAAIALAGALAHAQTEGAATAPAASPPAAPETAPQAVHRRGPHPSHGLAPQPAAPMAAAAPARPGALLAPGAPIAPVELEAFVDGVVREAMASDHIAGVAVSVVQNGQTTLKRGYGFARQSPMTPVDPDRTLFRLGGISKTFTWIAVMKEVESGRMGLANPINQYLPEKLQVRDQGFSRPITVQTLMSHTAGFESRVLGQMYERAPDRIRPLPVYLRQERPRRVRESGALAVESDYGAALAGEAAAEVAHDSFQRLTERDIFLPLGLMRTTFREPYPVRAGLPEPMRPDLAGDISQGFRWADGELRPRPFEYLTQIAPAAAASSTAADMTRYMAMMLNGGTLDGATVYSPATALAFRTVASRSPAEVGGWAHGFRQMTLPGGFTAYGAEGATLSFRATLVTAPQLGLGVFTAANTETGRALAERLPQLIVEHFYGGTRTLPSDGAAAPPQRGDYAGIYLNERRAYFGLEKFVGVLTRAATIDVSPSGRLVTRSGAGARSWIALGDGRFQAADSAEVSAFALDGPRADRWFTAWRGDSFKRASLLSQWSTIVVLGLLVLVASLATLIGLLTRDRRDFRQTSIQSRASALQTASAVLWIAAVLSFSVWWGSISRDVARSVYGWPGPWLLLASACALVAGLLTVAAAALLPAIWKGGRRLDSWPTLRKLWFTLSTVLFAALAAVLAMNGALEPWSG